MFAVIDIGKPGDGFSKDNVLSIVLSSLEAAQLVASRAGFNDVDVDSWSDNHHTVTASGPEKSPVTGTGRTREEACQSLMKALWPTITSKT